jgi:hypothetical protein
MIRKLVSAIWVVPMIFRSSLRLATAFDRAADSDFLAALKIIDEIEDYGLEPDGEQLLLKALCLSHYGNHLEAVSIFKEAWDVWRRKKRLNPDEITYIKMFIEAHYEQEYLRLIEDNRVKETFSKDNIPSRYLRRFVFEMEEENGAYKLRP